MESPEKTHEWSRRPATSRRVALAGVAHVYAELAKWRLSALVVATAATGFLVAPPGPGRAASLLGLALGTFLCAGGANGLNEWIEADRDARMERTRSRPLPSGRIGPAHAFAASLTAALAGVAVLAVSCNLLTAALGAANIVVYTLAYTPLKPVTSLNTLVGAVCGAIPPLMGWAAAAGRLDPGALALAGVLFTWQIPHSLSLAYLHRADYERGGFCMLPVVERSGLLTFHVINLYALALLPISWSAWLLGLASWRYTVGATLCGLVFASFGVILWRRRGAADARRLFLASLAYLPALMLLLVVDHQLSP